MTHVVIHEHGRLWRGERREGRSEDLANRCVDIRAYERLFRFDSRRSRKEPSVFTWGRDHAKASQWVGVIQVPGLTLEILPKIEPEPGENREAGIRRNLIHMLTVAGWLPAREQDLADLESCRSPLFDVLIRLFADRLRDELLRGPDRAYVAREENLHKFKGRLLVPRHIAANAAHAERFFCAYDEFSEDTALARVFKAACGLLHRATKNTAAQHSLRNCLMLLDEVADEPNPVALLDRVHITRQNERFRDLFHFAAMVLRDQAPEPRAGGERTFSLLYDMNALFEAFVTVFLRRYVVPELTGGSLTVQGRGEPRYLMRRQKEDGQSRVLRMKPDLLVQGGEMDEVIIDTKWKTVWEGEEREGIARNDLYQMFAYTHRYGVKRSVLLYPQPADMPEKYKGGRYLFCSGQENEPGEGDKEKRLDTAYLDLGGNLRQRRDALVKTLRAVVLGAVEPVSTAVKQTG